MSTLANLTGRWGLTSSWRVLAHDRDMNSLQNIDSFWEAAVVVTVLQKVCLLKALHVSDQCFHIVGWKVDRRHASGAHFSCRVLE
jgi:hypothetical protein